MVAGSSAGRTALEQRSEDGPELSVGLQAWNGGEKISGGPALSSLAGSAGASAWNVALRADGLGTVQVRAHLNGDQFGAAITVERHDAHALLSTDLSALRQGLADRQLRVDNVSLLQGSAADDSSQRGSHAGGGAARQQQHESSPARLPAGEASSSFLGTTDSSRPSDGSEIRTAFDSNGRLSVRA
jgi:hypothetical protein